MKNILQILTTLLLLSSSLTFADGISINNPYVREVPPGQMTSASFMLLKNSSSNDIALIKASSDIAKNVEIHEHIHEDGMMKMRQVKKITVKANSTTELKPGGYHVMLIGLTRKIKSGDIIELELEFDNGDKKAIKAEVKKVMQGMMKKSASKMDDNAIKKHINPMPNLMSVYKKMAGKLSLSKEQVVALDAGIKERDPKVQQLTKTIIKLEGDLKAAILNDDSLTTVDQLADKLMQNRLAMVQAKAQCHEITRDILSEEQFAKMITLYRKNMMPKPIKMNAEKEKMAVIKHTNPLPNLMLVVQKMADKLNLTEKQTADLKQWQNERDPIMARQYKAVIEFEKEIMEAALNNEPRVKIDMLADSIMQIRMKILRGKAFSRDNMKRVLDDNQYKKVIDLYKKHFS